MNFLKKIIFKLSGFRFIQSLLEKNIFLSQKLIGIGSGADVNNSGEEVLIKKILQLESDDVIIFDVGANTGAFSNMITSGLTGKIRFQLHAFEPSGYTFNKLREKISQGKNIFLNNLALGKNEGSAELYFEKEGSGLASLTKRKLQHIGIDFNKSEKILVNTLDSYCEANKIDRIDLLKIDVEGHEMHVLEGSRKMFQKNAVRMVSFEFGGCNIDTRSYYRDFYYFFKEQKMEIYKIIPSGKLMPMDGYREIQEQFSTTNFLAVAKELNL